MKKRILALVLALMTLCPLLVACNSHYNYDSYKDMIILGDISKIDLKEADIENSILGAYYDFFSDEISAKTLTSTSVTTGEVKYGDTVNIDYNGYKRKDDGTYETTAFEGGSTYDDNGKPSGSDLELGSGSFIDGFESGLIGHEIGETVSLYLTFPETYSSEELAGKQVRFDVVINKVTTRYAYPEMTDAKVKEQSGGEFDTVEEFKKDARETAIKNLIWSDYYQLCKVKKWPEKELKDYYYNSLEQYKSYAAMMGTDLDTYAGYMGYSAGTGYTAGDALRAGVMSQARQQCKQDIMVLAFVEEHGLKMTDKDLEKAMKELYKEAVAGGYDGSYKKYLKDNEESAVEIAAYTDVVMDYLTGKVNSVDNKGKNGIYGTASSGVRYYINGVKQTGWCKVDLDGDGKSDTYYFNPDLDGRAYLNVAVKMKAEGSETEQYLKFGDKGIFKGVANNEIVYAKLTNDSNDEGGYAYIENDTFKTGLVTAERTGAIEGNEQYLFGKDGYMALGAVKLTADNFPGLDFGDYTDKYYNFGTDGVFNFDLTTKQNGKYGDDSQNGIANGLIDEKAYKDGDMIVSDTYVDSENNTYYFNENGEMAKAKFVSIEGELYYFDNGGKMIKGTAEKNHELEINGITYSIDANGVVTSAKRFVENVAQTNTVYTDSNNNVYYFGDGAGEMVRNDIVENVKVGDVEATRYFDAYGKMVKSADDTPINVTVGADTYSIDKNGVATKVTAA